MLKQKSLSLFRDFFDCYTSLYCKRISVYEDGGATYDATEAHTSPLVFKVACIDAESNPDSAAPSFIRNFKDPTNEDAYYSRSGMDAFLRIQSRRINAEDRFVYQFNKKSGTLYVLQTAKHYKRKNS